MKTKKEILNYLKTRKELYETNIIKYNKILNNLDHKSNDYKMYEIMKQKENEHLHAIYNLMEFILED